VSISARALKLVKKPEPLGQPDAPAKTSFRGKYHDETLFGVDVPEEKLVALAISFFANGVRRTTYVDPLTMAKRAGVKHAAVLKAINKLEAHKRLSVHKRHDA
jgi:hypothetical protein